MRKESIKDFAENGMRFGAWKFTIDTEEKEMVIIAKRWDIDTTEEVRFYCNGEITGVI